MPIRGQADLYWLVSNANNNSKRDRYFLFCDLSCLSIMHIFCSFDFTKRDRRTSAGEQLNVRSEEYYPSCTDIAVTHLITRCARNIMSTHAKCRLMVAFRRLQPGSTRSKRSVDTFTFIFTSLLARRIMKFELLSPGLVGRSRHLCHFWGHISCAILPIYSS
jgi:hypothetical protein